jgi:hypothetical protein
VESVDRVTIKEKHDVAHLSHRLVRSPVPTCRRRTRNGFAETACRGLLRRVSLLALHAAATWFMVGLIWTIQVVHYPLLLAVPASGFTDYERSHTRRMGALLALPAGVEIVTAATLVWVRPDRVGLAPVLIAGALLAMIWIMTATVQAPIHGRLSEGHDSGLIVRLVASNWWRTAAWTLRGVIVTSMLIA